MLGSMVAYGHGEHTEQFKADVANTRRVLNRPESTKKGKADWWTCKREKHMFTIDNTTGELTATEYNIYENTFLRYTITETSVGVSEGFTSSNKTTKLALSGCFENANGEHKYTYTLMGEGVENGIKIVDMNAETEYNNREFMINKFYDMVGDCLYNCEQTFVSGLDK